MVAPSDSLREKMPHELVALQADLHDDARMRTSLFIILALAACSSDPAVTVDAKPQIDAAAVDAPPTAVTLDCPSYCTQIAANCTGANSQYKDTEHCTATCAKFPLGALADMANNTLGCRIYHSGAPSVANATLHCPHAGPGGGLVAPVAAGAMEDKHCDSPCVNFCKLDLAICSGANAQYTDEATCLTACNGNPTATPPVAGFDRATPYSAASMMGNTLACRIYHLTNAATSDAAATTHCQHTKAVPTQACI